MDNCCFSEVLTLNCNDMKICGSPFFTQLSKLTFGTRSVEWCWFGWVQLSSIFCFFSTNLLKDEESYLGGRTCYCKLGNTYPSLIEKGKLISWIFQWQNSFQILHSFPYEYRYLWRVSCPEFVGQGLWSLPCSELVEMILSSQFKGNPMFRRPGGGNF